MGIKILPPIKETSSDFKEIEVEIIKVLRREIYHPLLREFEGPQAPSKKWFKNAKDEALKAAIESGKITFNRGAFSGKFNAETTKELKLLGATWDRSTSSFRINRSMLPEEVRRSIDASFFKFNKTVDSIVKRLSKIIPAEIAEKVKTEQLFDSTLWKTSRKVDETLKAITVLPEMTPERVKKIAKEWQFNMDKWIKDFTDEEVVRLRDEVQSHVMTGGRYESIIDSIQRSYGVTQKKAKFLARQETSLLMTKFKESRYTEAGVQEYIWGCVTGTDKHPVRESHKILAGKTYRWDDPPITTAPNEPVRRNNPGEDYNCRCFAKPIVRF